MATGAAGMAGTATMTAFTAAGECIGGNSNASDRQGGCQKRDTGLLHFKSFPLTFRVRPERLLDTVKMVLFLACRFVGLAATSAGLRQRLRHAVARAAKFRSAPKGTEVVALCARRAKKGDPKPSQDAHEESLGRTPT